MVFNPVIIGAIVGQSIISKYSQIAGAITGFAITSGILIWGLIIYSQGNQIAFFGIPITAPVFIIACLIWFRVDIKEINKARTKTNNTPSDENIDIQQVKSEAGLDTKFEEGKDPVAYPGYSCTNCNYTIAEKDFNQETFFCPECGDRLLAD